MLTSRIGSTRDFLLRYTRYPIAAPKSAIPATPPTTPPAMAPVFDLEPPPPAPAVGLAVLEEVMLWPAKLMPGLEWPPLVWVPPAAGDEDVSDDDGLVEALSGVWYELVDGGCEDVCWEEDVCEDCGCCELEPLPEAGTVKSYTSMSVLVVAHQRYW